MSSGKWLNHRERQVPAKGALVFTSSPYHPYHYLSPQPLLLLRAITFLDHEECSCDIISFTLESQYLRSASIWFMRRSISVNYSRSLGKWQSTRPVTQIGPDSRPKLIPRTLSVSEWRVPWLWTQTGATTPQDDWHCTWWPCPAVTAAPRYCGSFPPGTALAYFPGEEDDKESWTQQRETTWVTQVFPEGLPEAQGRAPMPSPIAHPTPRDGRF